jgi:hypothetical protein
MNDSRNYGHRRSFGQDQRPNRYERHPLAVQFGPPPLDERSPAFKALRDSVKKKLRHPIVLYEGKVLCGWSRYRACLEAGTEPVFEECEGSAMNAIERIVDDDGLRRHMNYTQRVYAASKMVTSTHGGDRNSVNRNSEYLRKTAAEQEANLPLAITRDMAANWWDVSVKGVSDALKTLREAEDSPVREKIDAALTLGKVSFGQVSTLVQKTTEEQWDVVQSDEWKFGKLRERLAPEHLPKRMALSPLGRASRMLDLLDETSLCDLFERRIWPRLGDEKRAQVVSFVSPWAANYERENGL